MGRLAKIACWLSAILMCSGVILWFAARPATPDAFYDQPAQLPVVAGTMLRSEKFVRAIPQGAMAWRILYSTNRPDGTPTLASALVLAAESHQDKERSVVAWAHGTTGIVAGCAPSLLAKPFANIPALESALRQGWIIVAPDYAGLGTAGGHRYLVGQEAAASLVDAVLATRQMRDLRAGKDFVVWGHSQGGNTALWTAMIRNINEITGLKGVAALAPASDLKALISTVHATTFGKIVSAYVLASYAATYSDIDAAMYRRGGGVKVLVDDMAERCVGGWPTLLSALQSKLLPADGIFQVDPASGSLGERLAQNTPAGPYAVPVLVAQGLDDDLVLPKVQAAFVNRLCREGRHLAYRTYAARDHISLVNGDTPLAEDLVAWTRDRLTGKPQNGSCGQAPG